METATRCFRALLSGRREFRLTAPGKATPRDKAPSFKNNGTIYTSTACTERADIQKSRYESTMMYITTATQVRFQLHHNTVFLDGFSLVSRVAKSRY